MSMRHAVRSAGAGRYAMADAFCNQHEACLSCLKPSKAGDRVAVAPERRFAGFDAHRHVMDCCDVVVSAVPPRLRPAASRRRSAQVAASSPKNPSLERPLGLRRQSPQAVHEVRFNRPWHYSK